MELKNENIVIITDLEPDDLIAITLMLNSTFAHNKHCIFVISAWSDVQAKAKFFRAFLEKMFPTYKNCKIYLGEPSNKMYALPDELISSSTEEFDSYKMLDISKSLIINLAPIRELLYYYKKDKAALLTCNLAIYASFNIRSVLLKGEATCEEVYDMLGSFNSVLYYETFLATGQVNSISDVNVLDIIKNQYPLLNTMILWWNKLIMNDCEETCKVENKDGEKYKRNMKVLKNIEAEPRQFVNADTGLMTVIINEELRSEYIRKGNICFVAGSFYTVFDANPEGNITMVKCDDGSLLPKQIKLFCELLNKA